MRGMPDSRSRFEKAGLEHGQEDRPRQYGGDQDGGLGGATPVFFGDIGSSGGRTRVVAEQYRQLPHLPCEDTETVEQDCPIARHSPLPELQALVKLFRPKSLSPNTMISEARGLDYFLLPSLFSDCLAQSGFDALVRERDEWFTANVKYGRPYIEGLKRMQLKGVELLPNLENGSERDEYLPESLDLDSSAKLGAGRRAHAADQMARAGGLPKTFGGMTPAQGQHISALLGGVGVSNLETGLVLEPGRGPPRSGDDDYNTDEEEDVKRKRRRREGSFGKVIAKEIEEPKVEIPVQKEEYEAAKLEIPVQTDIKREHWTTAALTESSEAKMEAAEVKVEDVKPIIPDRSRRRPRISLNRDHLRALSVMPADVDVL